jgi:hypothetical protein
MTSLLLKRASASRSSGEWNDDDYDVLADSEVVGRIMKVHAAPKKAPTSSALRCWCRRPDNSFDPNAIMVFITGEKVGYLPRKAAARYNEARQAHGVDLAVCDATIVGGWDRGDDDVGHFGVRLDVSQPFRFENIRDWEPPASQAATQQPTRRSRYSAILAVVFICAGAMAWYVMTSSSAPRATVATDYPLKPSQAPAWTGAITEASAAPSKAEPIVADQARETVPLPRPRPATGPLRLVRSP